MLERRRVLREGDGDSVIARTPQVPRPFAFYAGMILIAGLAGLLASWIMQPPIAGGLLLLLLASVVIAEILAVEMPNGVSTSLSYPLTMATIILLGPAAGGLVAVLSGLSPRDLARRRPLSLYAFNVGQLVLSAVLAGHVYVLLGGRILADSTSGSIVPLASSDFPSVLVALAASAVVSFLSNDLMFGLGLKLLRGVSFREAWRSGPAWMLPTQAALATVGVSIAQVLAVSRLGFLLFVFPLLVARQVYQMYLSAREAYVDSVKSLIGALEAKDPYTRGHSERVAGYAVRIGTAMGLEPSEVARLEYAALMHDLGKLAVPRAVLTKPGRLDEWEFSLIREHPQRGADIVSSIPYLEGLADFVRDHHERFDGTGYGRGVAGEDLSLFARILAVADSYDAMTTKRQYREAMTRSEAERELLACSGSQFDPAVIDAFLPLLATGILTDEYHEGLAASQTPLAVSAGE